MAGNNQAKDPPERVPKGFQRPQPLDLDDPVDKAFNLVSDKCVRK